MLLFVSLKAYNKATMKFKNLFIRSMFPSDPEFCTMLIPKFHYMSKMTATFNTCSHLLRPSAFPLPHTPADE